MEQKTRKIAVYSLYGNGEYIQDVTDFYENDEDYTRLTEPVEVEFIPLPREIVVPSRIRGLQSKIAEIRADTQRRVAQLEEEISKLQAITYYTEEEGV